MDQEAEVDKGSVELVNAKEDENGDLTESSESTNLWAGNIPTRRKGRLPIPDRRAGGL